MLLTVMMTKKIEGSDSRTWATWQQIGCTFHSAANRLLSDVVLTHFCFYTPTSFMFLKCISKAFMPQKETDFISVP